MPTARRAREPPEPKRGSLSKEVIRRTIHEYINPVRLCFEQGLQRTRVPANIVVVEFTISATGAVRDAVVKRSDADRTTQRCIRAVVRAMTFPPPEGGGIVSVTYPFGVDWAPSAYELAAPPQSTAPPSPAAP